MKYYIAFFCLIFTVNSFAQTDFKVSTLSGFETNINRSPSSLEIDDELFTREDLHLNSFYQDVKLRFKYQKEWKYHSFSFLTTPKIRYYLTEFENNQKIFYGRLGHKYLLSRYTKWENSFSYKLKDRGGQDLDQNELNVPFGYNYFKLSTGIRYRLFKNNRSFTQLNYGRKQFDRSETRRVSYQYYTLKTEFRSVKWINHLLHYYGLEMSYTKRDYSILNFSSNNNDSRTWNYIDATLYYKHPFSKFFSIKPEISFQRRHDTNKNTFSYNQIRPEVNVSYEDARFLVELNGSYTYRKFDNVNARNSDEEITGNLEYNYLRIGYDLTYNLTNKLSLISEGYLINRNSNNTNINSGGFRSYINNYIGVGLSYNF